ncbi:MAG: 3-methyl-2-oxobutanoate hydroxymethyltransferase [Oscillospiraceae bacterium]|jgi:3-methyl-2-oxobutanoate hydroxymethyltransferase|nr:3-methyl-2-oxobutanoate hydroxymethyltransferase [Oscillospiraceae bacterium]
MKKTVATITAGEKITVLTAYDYTTARLLDESGIDVLLVGDSLGMVMLGYKDTLSVTVEDMLHHTKAVARGTQSALILADMPFMSYQADVSEAVRNAGRLVGQGGANAVKLEGGAEISPQVRAITNAGIPVMGHIGLTPQTVNALGGFKVQGKTLETARKLVTDAKALEDAGAFAVLLECVPAMIAKYIADSLAIPTIGIGSGKYTAGQVLVIHDIAGLYREFTPKFVRRYADAGEEIKNAAKQYIKDVRSGEFPAGEHTFAVPEDVLLQITGGHA